MLLKGAVKFKDHRSMLRTLMIQEKVVINALTCKQFHKWGIE